MAELKNQSKRESEISFKTINSEIFTLSNFFNYFVEKKIILSNPASRIKKLNELKRIKTMADEDIEKFINSFKSKPVRDLITFLIYTGCRKSEALNLKWDDVDLKNDIIAIKGTKTKTDRFIPISEALKEIILNIERTENEFVFVRNNKRINSHIWRFGFYHPANPPTV